MRLTVLLPALLLAGCIQQSVPSTDLAVAITPADPIAGSTLVVEVTTEPTGSFTELTYEYQWLEDGQVREELTGASISGGLVEAGAIWRVVVLPYGDGVEGMSASASVTILGGPTGDPDADGDGSPASLDCDDDDPTRYPGADDVCDGADTDCDPASPPGDVDVDSDGSPACDDCDDSDPDRYPGNSARECLDGGASTDCVPFTTDELVRWMPDLDGDLDGEADVEGALHCPDGDPGAGWVQTPTSDCDDTDPVLNGHDADGDGVSSCQGDLHPDGSSADDDAALSPSQPEACNGIDDDLDGEVDEGFDLDGDGSFNAGEADCVTTYGAANTDCDDSDPTRDTSDADNDGQTSCQGDCDDADPTLEELDSDGDGLSTCDGDCDDNDGTLNLDDADNDGFTTCGGDCDDGNDAVWPGNAVQCDGIDDTDCDGVSDPLEADADGDGVSICGGDCDDGDAGLHLTDADGDGLSPCGGDCDDSSSDIAPGAPALCDGVLDNDCNGAADLNEADADNDGNTLCDGDCDDTDVSVENLDTDGDGVTTCDGDCDDSDANVSPLNDFDGDGWSQCASDLGPADCDDTDGSLNHTDQDGDGESSCDGDCSDFDPDLNYLDADTDGETSCDGDCDDDNAYASSSGVETWDGVDNDCDGTADEGLISVGDLAIVEVMVQPHALSTDALGEFVEVYNNTVVDIDLRGWTLEVQGTSTESVTLPAEPDGEPLVVSAGGRLVIARADNIDAYGFDIADVHLNMPPLPNNGATLTLSFGATVVDAIAWGASDCVQDCDGGPNPIYSGSDTWRPGYSFGLSHVGATPHLANDAASLLCEERDVLGSNDFGSPGLAPVNWGHCEAN